MLRTLRAVTPRNFNPLRNANGARQGTVETPVRRQTAQGDRLASALADGFDAGDTAAQRLDALKDLRQKTADIHYDAARADGCAVDLSPVISHIDDILRRGVPQLVDPADNLARDRIERTLMGYRPRMTEGKSTMTDLNRALNLGTDLGDAAQKAGGNTSRILGSLNWKLDSAREEAAPMYRAK